MSKVLVQGAREATEVPESRVQAFRSSAAFLLLFTCGLGAWVILGNYLL
eukprot:SAG11_NODE_20079_length_453_cov_0.878531_1_plen_48_part_01